MIIRSIFRQVVTTRHLLATGFLLVVGSVAAAGEVADAAAARNLSRMRTLIAEGADVSAAQPDGTTALHWAAARGDAQMIQMLVDAGASIEAQNRSGLVPILLAAQSGNGAALEALLGAGADPNALHRNAETPLMMAARTGSPDAVRVLLAAGAEVDAAERLRGTTALMWAAANGNAEVMQILIDAGADIAARSATSEPGRRPYLAPSARNRIEAYQRTVETGVTDPSLDIDAPRPQADEDEGEAAAAPASEQEENENRFLDARSQAPAPWGGLTALVFAAREGDLDAVRVLVEAGADVNQTTEFGWTALLTATQNRFYRIGEYLLSNGADPNIQNGGGWSALYLATDNRNIEGGDYPTRRPDMDHLDFIRLLFEHGADPDLRMRSSTETRTVFTNQWLREDGATAFLRAAQSGDLELIELLLEDGADPSIATEAGVTPLMVAAGIGWVEGVTFEWSAEQNLAVVDLLLELGADVNAVESTDLRTALMGAAHKGRTAVIERLVAHGADLAARDIGSRDSIYALAGARWQAIDYADGLVRVGVQSSVPQPEAAALLRRLMTEAGLAVPPAGRTLDSICITDICQPE